MQHTHIDVCFLIDGGELVFRRHEEDGHITGRYMAHDRMTYHNTATLWKPNQEDQDIDIQGLKELLARAIGGDYTDEDRGMAIAAIKLLQQTH